MTTQRSTSGASKLALLAVGLPALTIATAAFADDAAAPAAAPAAASAAVAQAAPATPATTAKPKLKHTPNVAEVQPETNNALVNAEADQVATPPAPLSSQAKSQGLI